MGIENIGVDITKEVIGVVIAWMRRPIVTVIALDKNKNPVKGAIIKLNSRCEKTVAAGRAIFEGLSAGKYVLSVKYGDKEEPDLDIIYLEAGEKTTVILTLPDSLFELVQTPNPDSAKVIGTSEIDAIPIVKDTPLQPHTIHVVEVDTIERDPFEFFIKDLATFVRINANGELDMTESQKIKDTILRTSQNLGAAFLVVQYLDEIKQDLLKQFLENLKNQLKAKSYHLIWDKELIDTSRNNGFSILFYEQQDKYLSFEFESGSFNSLFWGIRKKDANVAISSAAREEIAVIMRNIFQTARNSDCWPWWARPEYAGLNEFKHWSKNPAPWQAMQDGTLADKIIGISDKVHAAFKDRMYLLMP